MSIETPKAEKFDGDEDYKKWLDPEDKSPHRPEDLEAARALVLENPILRNDSITASILKRGGFTVKGEKVTNFDRFLDWRLKKLEADLPYGKSGARARNDLLIDHSKTWQEGEGSK